MFLNFFKDFVLTSSYGKELFCFVYYLNLALRNLWTTLIKKLVENSILKECWNFKPLNDIYTTLNDVNTLRAEDEFTRRTKLSLRTDNEYTRLTLNAIIFLL